jgi:hypothetical protein
MDPRTQHKGERIEYTDVRTKKNLPQTRQKEEGMETGLIRFIL